MNDEEIYDIYRAYRATLEHISHIVEMEPDSSLTEDLISCVQKTVNEKNRYKRLYEEEKERSSLLRKTGIVLRKISSVIEKEFESPK